ncbi:DUF6114 domain-containing protein [Actinoplanes sp. NPDC049681]|uniref:DUF6114 domain-containing protein n=1 Tax=Actinoplanes sp. NPDC049681 TaxID=3363905 RepID=UPI0037AFCA80
MVTPNTSAGGGFRHWRRTRPFWGGLLLLLSGLELFLSANLTLGDMEVHFGPEGFLSYLLPLLLLLCGILTWLTPGQRIFYGILGLLTAVYSLIGLNFGGFLLGMFLGILGGALVLSWSPRKPQPPVAIPDDVAEPHDPAEPAAELPYGAPPEATAPLEAAAPYGPAPSADDTAVLRPSSQSGIVPGFTGAEAASHGDDPEAPRPPSGGVHRKAFVIALVPLVFSAAVVAGSRTPARADDECPDGLPSRPAAAAKKEAARQSSASVSAKAKTKTETKAKTKAKTTTSAPAARRSASASTPGKSSPAKADEAEEGDGKTGNPIVDGWNSLVDGVGDLLGIGDDESASDESAAAGDETASPSASPSTGTSAPEETTPSSPAPATSEPTGPATTPGGKPTPDGSASTGAPAGSASPSPAPSPSDIPCLGPRVFKVAGPDDVPTVSVNGGVLESKSLTMYNSTYDGVVDLDTAQGTLKALKFSMTKSVTKPFRLTVPEKADGQATVIDSNELTTEGNVKFYTPKFQGKLFGLIPVTFTPEQPPPLTLPVLWFTDVKIQLAFVRCDTLTADPLKLTEKS